MAKAVKTPVPQPDVQTKAPRYVVVQVFRDRADFARIHEAGADVSHFEASRLEHLVNTGMVKKQ